MTSNEALATKLDDLQRDVQEIKVLAKETNGRLRALELWRARLEGARLAVSWLPPFVTAICASGVGVVVGIVVTH